VSTKLLVAASKAVYLLSCKESAELSWPRNWNRLELHLPQCPMAGHCVQGARTGAPMSQGGP
jgi:hypothetical protein